MRPLAILVFLLLCHFSAQAQTTWYVPDDYPIGIQAAVSDPAVVNGDTIIVRPGRYLENIDFLGKAITLRSEQGPASTFISGDKQTTAVRFNNNEGLDSVLDGFTITNSGFQCPANIICYGSSPSLINNWIINNEFGSGILLNDSSAFVDNNLIQGNYYMIGVEKAGIVCTGSFSNAVISNNTITENGYWSYGGGIVCTVGVPVITGNTITANSGRAGIYCTDSSPSIHGNIICNTRGVWGYGIYCSKSKSEITSNWITGNQGGISVSDSNLTLMNNIIAKNRNDESGGGISCSDSKLILTNNTIARNSAVFNGGGISCNYDCVVKIRNSILWDNAAASGNEIALSLGSSSLLINHSDVKGGIGSTLVNHSSSLDWGTNMLDADPLFVDPANDDFHITFHSPCKDGGNNSAPHSPLTDNEGDPRIAYGTVDMGADEFHPHLYYTGDATPSGTIQAKFIGLPGNSINGVIMGFNIFNPPLPCDYGLWYMDNPMQILTGLGTIPASGIAVFPGTLPSTPPAPYTIYLQAAIDSWLTNLCTVNVQ